MENNARNYTFISFRLFFKGETADFWDCQSREIHIKSEKSLKYEKNPRNTKNTSKILEIPEIRNPPFPPLALVKTLKDQY
jgi:hypothetical protein